MLEVAVWIGNRVDLYDLSVWWQWLKELLGCYEYFTTGHEG